MSVLSRSLFSLNCRTSRGNQRRFLPRLFNSHRNVIKYCPSWRISRYCSPSWVPGPSVNTDPRGGPALPDRPSFSARRRSVIPRGGIIVNPPDVFSVLLRSPSWNGNASFKSGQRVAVWPDFPQEKQTTSVQSRRACRCRGGCRCHCHCPSSKERNICSSVVGTGGFTTAGGRFGGSLTSCCNSLTMSDISGFGAGRSALDITRRIKSAN